MNVLTVILASILFSNSTVDQESNTLSPAIEGLVEDGKLVKVYSEFGKEEFIGPGTSYVFMGHHFLSDLVWSGPNQELLSCADVTTDIVYCGVEEENDCAINFTSSGKTRHYWKDCDGLNLAVYNYILGGWDVYFDSFIEV